tara:strand:- start:213 stop:350 length:138 start_codon:yes stop_codon:yes gene_type:complete
VEWLAMKTFQDYAHFAMPENIRQTAKLAFSALPITIVEEFQTTLE